MNNGHLESFHGHELRASLHQHPGEQPKLTEVRCVCSETLQKKNTFVPMSRILAPCHARWKRLDFDALWRPNPTQQPRKVGGGRGSSDPPTKRPPRLQRKDSVETPTAKPATEIPSDNPFAKGDTLALPIKRSAEPATFTWSLPNGLATLDSLDKADPKPLQGYRIQIYFGDLQEASAVRAAFRRDHPEEACQLMPITPNYAVTVG